MDLTSHSEIAEMQGYYGPVRISERTIQKIWLGKKFNQTGLKTDSGKTIVVVDPGQWNQQEGPDFKSAVLEIDGKKVTGDVEIHFYSRDWCKHGHNTDPHYDNVVLHAVVYDDVVNHRQMITSSGKKFYTTVLLNLLTQDLESYQDEDNLLDFQKAFLPLWLEKLQSMEQGERMQFFFDKARSRWIQKCIHVKNYLKEQSWEHACHQMTLEVLGYRRNRVPMAKIALEHSFSSCSSGILDPEKVYRKHEGMWKLAGVRPANHPRRRLNQYFSVVENNPRCFELLYSYLVATGTSNSVDQHTNHYRKEFRLSQLRQKVVANMLSDAFAGSRSDTLMVDAYLPLFSVASNVEVFDLWFHWYMGDVPDWVRRVLKEVGFGRKTWPYSNGLAQAMIQCYHDSYAI